MHTQSPESNIPFSVIILAGGYGRRLGRDKATVEVGGRLLLHWSVLAASQVSDDIVVSRRPDQQLPPLDGAAAPGWREAIDRRHDRGPLAGLESALPLIQHELAVAVACDMPLLQPALLRAVAQSCDGVDLAMPQIEGVAQPLLAAYRASLAPLATSLLERGEGRLRALLALAPHRLLEVDALRRHDPTLVSFTNLNHAEDLRRVEGILGARSAR